MNVYVFVAFAAVVAFALGAGLIALDHYFENKRNKKIGKIVCKDVIPTAEMALDEYTEHLMENLKKMSDDMMKNFKEQI